MVVMKLKYKWALAAPAVHYNNYKLNLNSIKNQLYNINVEFE